MQKNHKVDVDPLRQQHISPSRAPLIALLVGMGYYAGALFGFALTFNPVPISMLWPPNSLLMAALLLIPVRSWWLVLAAVLPAHLAAELQSGVPTSMVLSWFVSNSVEALLGAVLIRHHVNGALRFDSVRHVGLFLLFGAFVAPFLSSFLDAALVRLIGWGEAGYWQVWRFRLPSNMLAAVLLVPVIVSWHRLGLAPLRRASWCRYVEAGLLMLGLLAVNAVLFALDDASSAVTPVFLYAPMPFLVWAAVRFGPTGISTALLWVAALVLWKTLHYEAPFFAQSPVESALAIQLFLMVVAAPLLFLAAALAEQEAARRALSHNEERLRLALSAAQISTWDWHAAENRVALTDIAMQMLKPTHDQIQGSFEIFSSNIHPQDRRSVLRAIERAIAGKTTTFERSFRVVRPDGEVRWIRGKGQVFYDAAGRAARMIGVSLDFTAQRKIEIELARQHQQITYLNRVAVLGELSGALAHELSQPLTAILANAQAARLLMAREPLDTAELRAILDDIISDDHRAGEIIRGLYALFKKTPPQVQSLDINQLVRDVLVLAQTDFLVRGVEANVELADGLPAILGDRIQLQQVLLNLIINACEAMADKRAEQRKLLICTQTHSAGAVRISVADRGCGIPAGQEQKLFEAFFTTKEQGLGLGLSICRSIVLSHGGRLWAENNSNGGATFHIDLKKETQRTEEKTTT